MTTFIYVIAFFFKADVNLKTNMYLVSENSNELVRVLYFPCYIISFYHFFYSNNVNFLTSGFYEYYLHHMHI